MRPTSNAGGCWRARADALADPIPSFSTPRARVGADRRLRSDGTSISTGVDLQVDRVPIEATLQLSQETFAADDCAVVEGATQPGLRRLLALDTVVVNRGNEDLVVGNPPTPSCRSRKTTSSTAGATSTTILGFATYELRTPPIDQVGFGHKRELHDRLAPLHRQAAAPVRLPLPGHHGGLGDRYGFDLDGQWVDVTGLPPGAYAW